MQNFNFILLFIVNFLSFIRAESLPSFIPKCKLNDAVCQKESLSAVFTKYPAGIPEIGLEPTDPFIVPNFNTSNLASTNRLLSAATLNVKDTKIIGFSRAKISNYEFKKKGNQFKNILHFKLPSLLIKGKYEAEAQVTSLPISGRGPFTIEMINPTIDLKFIAKLEKRENGDYFKIHKLRCTFDMKNVRVDIQNLFNGDRILGQTVNEFLNNNYREIFSYMSQQIYDGISEFLKDRLQMFYDRFSYNDLISE